MNKHAGLPGLPQAHRFGIRGFAPGGGFRLPSFKPPQPKGVGLPKLQPQQRRAVPPPPSTGLKVAGLQKVAASRWGRGLGPALDVVPGPDYAAVTSGAQKRLHAESFARLSGEPLAASMQRFGAPPGVAAVARKWGSRIKLLGALGLGAAALGGAATARHVWRSPLGMGGAALLRPRPLAGYGTGMRNLTQDAVGSWGGFSHTIKGPRVQRTARLTPE